MLDPLFKQATSTPAKNGFEALQILATGQQFDVILIDYHMPVIDGLETIKKIREMNTEAAVQQPIILLHSSSDDEKVIRACEELHVAQRLIKPIKMQDLYHVLTRLHKKTTTKEVENKGPETSFNSKNPLRILLVEDNKVNLLLARAILTKIAPEAVLVEAYNGEEAVQKFQASDPHIILMDIQMPVMNGYDAAQAIRAVEEERVGRVPIIALTAGNVKGEKERCLAAGMDDFIAKPFVEETLAAMFTKWLGTKEQVEPLDLSVLKNFLGGPDVKESTVRQALELSLEECEEIQAELEEKFRIENWQLLRAIGHRLYGIAAFCGLNTLAALARDAENATTEEQAADLQQQLMRELRQAIAVYRTTLEK